MTDMTKIARINYPPAEYTPITAVRTASDLGAGDFGRIIRFRTPQICGAGLRPEETMGCDVQVTGKLVGVSHTEKISALAIAHTVGGDGHHWFELSPSEWVEQLIPITEWETTVEEDEAGVRVEGQPVGTIEEGLIRTEPSPFGLPPVGRYDLHSPGGTCIAEVLPDGRFMVQPYEAPADSDPSTWNDHTLHARQNLGAGVWRVVPHDLTKRNTFKPDIPAAVATPDLAEDSVEGDAPDPEPRPRCGFTNEGVRCQLPDGHEGYHVAAVDNSGISNLGGVEIPTEILNAVIEQLPEEIRKLLRP
ncbi:hypothetical protein SEA_LILBEANIE_70 [Gordonia phage Lilbeanie]|uniref:Uncharacterized protein n=1 Tax=Gordonia phage Lilbeanie TaxID=2794947 RepID=A0A7T1KSF3_9CAUD|nr:hypothetical protein J1773_gp70 [Gordonia phage Lilbeanie]QPO17148.1 hypothetical protein SEA_LILBEANIE_70 [Gordonia phage Lilbeanie]